MSETTGVQARAANERSTLIVACTLRSGSNLLCELLERRGLGRPREYFQEESYNNSHSLRVASSPSLSSLAEVYQTFAQAHEQSAWLGVKWNWSQFRILNDTIRQSSDLGRFEDLFPRPAWIKLERQDKVAQAVSLFVAQHIGVWVNGDIGRVEHNLQYDFEEIYRVLGEILREEFAWTNFFKKNNIAPVSIVYEDLVANPDRECARLLRALGVPEGEPDAVLQSKSFLLNQRTSTSLQQEIASRFYDDIAKGRVPKKEMDFEDLLISLNRLYEKRAEDQIFTNFIGDHSARFPQIRKLNIDSDCTLDGEIGRIEEPHFLDGVGYRLDAGSRIAFRARARRILLRLLAHPWSGEAELCFGGEPHILDLYHPVTSTRPVLEHWPETALREVTICPRGSWNALSSGAEVWLQQIWVLAD